MPTITLHQFRYSHFNEKARWALDWKAVPHERVSYLPGPHMKAMRKLSGQSSVPVLQIDGTVVAGSAAILDALEERWPEPALYPAEPVARQKALEIQQHFDKVIGPAVRAAVYADLLPESFFLGGLFSAGKPEPLRFLYRASYPLVGRLIKKAYRVTDAAYVARALEYCKEGLDFVASTANGNGYLVGESFSVADLCCAALLAPLAGPDHPDMAWPRQRPARVEAFLARWCEHPGAQWVRERYARDRPRSAAQS